MDDGDDDDADDGDVDGDDDYDADDDNVVVTDPEGREWRYLGGAKLPLHQGVAFVPEEEGENLDDDYDDDDVCYRPRALESGTISVAPRCHFTWVSILCLLTSS